MKLRNLFAVVALTVLSASASHIIGAASVPEDATSVSQQAAKKRIGVATFTKDFQAGGNRNIEDEITEEFISLIYQDRSLDIIERRQIDAALRSQRIGSSGWIDPRVLQRSVKTLGVDYLVVGGISLAGVDTKEMPPTPESRLRLPFTNMTMKIPAKEGYRKHTIKIRINVLVVEVETGLTAATSEYTGTNTVDGPLGAPFQSNGNYMTPDIYMRAVKEPLGKLAAYVSNELMPLEASVIHVDGMDVVIDRGQSAGIKRGQVLQIIRNEIITDLQNNPIRITKKVGEIEITSVAATNAQGRIKSQQIAVKRGDVARR